MMQGCTRFGCEGERHVPVLLPSSMMRITMVPRWRTSPSLAGTKFKATLGVSINACAMVID